MSSSSSPASLRSSSSVRAPGYGAALWFFPASGAAATAASSFSRFHVASLASCSMRSAFRFASASGEVFSSSVLAPPPGRFVCPCAWFTRGSPRARPASPPPLSGCASTISGGSVAAAAAEARRSCSCANVCFVAATSLLMRLMARNEAVTSMTTSTAAPSAQRQK